MSGWRVPLPPGAEPPIRVFVNGVPQERGPRLPVAGDELVFDRPLEKERLSKGNWAAIFFGLWGYYGKNDQVDVHYRLAAGTLSPRAGSCHRTRDRLLTGRVRP